MTEPTGPPEYPQQELLPQQVARQRSRTPLVVGLVIVVLAVIAGVVVWQVVGSGGGGDRAAYCQRLRTALHGSGGTDVAGLAGTGALFDRLDSIRSVAPDAVRSAWDDLLRVAGEAANGKPPTGDILGVAGDLQTIVADANSQCGMHLHTGL